MSTTYRAGDNTDTIADRFRNSLSTGSTLTPGTINMSLSSSMPSYGNGKQIPKYESMLGMTIQTGDVAGDEVEIVYRSLSIATLGLNTLDTLTEASAKDGLGKVSRALDMISEQRSTFGAYQNRLEHTHNNDTNTAENVQASESRIRDTDMPEEMMQLSVQNILAQAGQSMLGQAMHDKDYIMNLLQ
ncbi:MAG: flagellin [Lachnospiraceae bacterium]|nr:flagellin [Lachnospiraceae bacterium]